jgi:dTDP-glucose 4,6-dehydratase
MHKTVLVTGVCGFIFSNFIRTAVIRYPDTTWIGVDKLVKDYNIDNIFKYPNYKFHIADIADKHTMDRIFQIHKPGLVINGAAESFVDNSITNILPFLHSNILGVQTIVDCCLENKAELLQVSTDEVYGQQISYPCFPWFEKDPLEPRNPYACSKACSEHIVRAAHITHGLQYRMTRSCNVFGPRQKHENLIPMIIRSIHKTKSIPIHGTGKNFRQYIFVDDVIEAFFKVIEDGEEGEVYNIGANNFFSNLEMAEYIDELMGRRNYSKIKFIEDRKAHDFGYNVNSAKLRNLGWDTNVSMKDGMMKTIAYYREKLANEG